VQFLERQHFVGVLHFRPVDAFVVLSQLELEELEGVSVLQKGVGGQGDIQQKGLRTCFADQIAIEVLGLADDLFFCCGLLH
jgi:hypothetical protein